MMLRHKFSLDRQVDERHYQFLVSDGGNYQEILAFAQEVAAYAAQQIEASKIKASEQTKEELKAE